MAVADVEKAEKVDKPEKPEKRGEARSGRPGRRLIGWVPRKIAEGRSFLSEVKAELKKVTWPSRKEVYSTTIVVIATSVFFGFYLWGLDLASLCASCPWRSRGSR